MNRPVPEAVKEAIKRSKGQSADLARLYLREHAYSGKLVSRTRSRAILALWIGGILVVGFICFTLANTVGRSLLGLEENLDHHRSYLHEARPQRPPVSSHDDSVGGDPDPE